MNRPASHGLWLIGGVAAVALGVAGALAADAGRPAARSAGVRPAAAAPQSDTTNPYDPATLFRRLDADRDGKLSKEEFGRLVEMSPRLRDDPGRAKQAFEYFDDDADGKLTLKEFQAMLSAGQNAGGPPPGRLPPPGALGRPPFGAPAAQPAVADKPLTTEQANFFEKNIRPVLVSSCYSCHSAQAKKIKGGLVLDTRDGVRRGGQKGPAVVPGDVDSSLLIRAIRHTDEDLAMPPKEKLPDAVVADFEKWVQMGAPDPRDGKTAVHSDIDIAKGKQFWAFRPPQKGAAPKVRDTSWPRSDVDRYLLAAMEGKGVKPVRDADAATLLRRVSFDLTGLPPSAAEVESFLADPSSAALEAAVDRMLSSPAFGERWGRHWLDVARYAESSGKQVNINYPHAWRYRDYVVDSFNADKPFDLFVKEQVAGDLMGFKDVKQQAERQIATGFLAIGSKSHNERNPLQFEMDLADEQIDATTQAVMGLTVACARCHDHKFDPIAQRDYYALAGIFRSTDTRFGTVRVIQNNQTASLVELPKAANLPCPEEKLGVPERAEMEAQLLDLQKQRVELSRQGGGPAQGNVQVLFVLTRMALLQARLDLFDKDGNPKAMAMGARDRIRLIDSPLYTRGEIDQPTQVIPRGFPQVLTSDSGEIKTKGSGRLELAEFLASDRNPLTARVWVNRVWGYLFGQGIVPTQDNFGAAGSLPSNQPLLDSLAASFVHDDHWSTKKLIRRLVLTHSYQLASDYNLQNNEIDPDNTLVWRASRRRLDAESIRDGVLTVAEQLDTKRPVGSPMARAGDGQAAQLLRFSGQLDANMKTRAVYLPIVRDQLPEILATFDFAEPSMVIGQRSTTSVPSQSLYMLNSPFVINAADAAATLLTRKFSDTGERVKQAYLKVYGRPPTPEEVAAARQFVESYSATIGSAADITPAAQRDAWTALVQSLMGSTEFLYLN